MHRDGGERRRRERSSAAHATWWWRRACGVALAATTAAACGGGPDQTLEKVSSWAASARLAAENRAAGATSARYTRNVLHATHAELEENVRALRTALDSSADSSKLAPPLRARALAAATVVERTVGLMARSADSAPGDRGALLRLAARADSAGEVASALADSAKQR